MFSEEISKLNSMLAIPQVTKIKPGTVEHDLRTKKIVNLYLEHKTYAQICKELDITAATVKNTISNLIKEWQKNDLKKFQRWRWEELEKINKIEAEMWSGWHASKQKPKKITMNAVSGRILRDAAGNVLSTDITPTSKRQEVTEEERFTGDMTIMETIKWCSKSRRELLGLDMPKKFVETADVEGNKSKAEFTRDEILAKLDTWAANNSASPKNYVDAEPVEQVEIDAVPESHQLLPMVEENESAE
jgi:hypothetical protein